MSAVNRPQFFCTRPNGTLTPLVAMDELPTHVTIRGVARTLTPSDTQGMTSCGMAATRSEPWVVDGLTSTGTRTVTNKEGLAELQSILLKVLADDTVTPELRLAVQGILYRGLDRSCFIADGPDSNGMAFTQANAAPLYQGNNSGGKHYNTKKEYCSYWIRHGECDYQQQGCLYKHEMPTDPLMLEKLGLRDIPRWYREKYNVSSLLHHGHPRAQQQQGQQWKDAVADSVPFKAIQYSNQITGDDNAPRVANGKYKVSPQRAASQPVYGGQTRIGPANVSNHHHHHIYHSKKNGHRDPMGSDTTFSSPDYNDDDSFGVNALSNKMTLLATTQANGPAATTARAYYDGHTGFVSGKSFVEDDVFSPSVTNNTNEKMNMRAHASRGLYDARNSDGGVKIKRNAAFNPFNRSSGYRTTHNSTPSTEMKSTGSPISQLGDSDALNDKNGASDFGAIGTPVKDHRSTNSPSQTGEAQFFVSGVRVN